MNSLIEESAENEMKKILFIGAGIIDKPHAAGITVRSIFDGINTSFVMGLVWGEAASKTKAPFELKKLFYSKFSPARFLDNTRLKQTSHKIKKAESTVVRDEMRSNQSSPVRKMIRNIRQRIALIPAGARVIVKARDLEEIRAFSPQVIYTVGESVATLRLAYQLSEKLEIPIVIHFMDNWKHSIEWASNPLLKRYQKKLSRYCDLCYTRTTECIAIGERMAEAYEKETGVKHRIIMNSVDTQKWFCTPRQDDGMTHFIYAGGLHLGRENALRTIGECIERLNEKGGYRADFSIYTSDNNIDLYSAKFNHLNSTFFRKAIPHDQIHTAYQDSDVLVHVESNALFNNEFFKYSVSTKIPEYMATGRPILFYGPENIYLFGFLRNNQLAYTVKDEEEIESVLMELIIHKENKYSENARNYVAQHFDVSVARQRFYSVIENVHLPSDDRTS